MIDINLNQKNATALKTAAGKQGFFLGGMGRSEIIADPYIGGYGFLLITFVPSALNEILPKEAQKLLEVSLKELNGINDIDLSTSGIQGGFTNNEHHYPTEINKNIFEITCKWQERTGNVFRKIFQNWTTAIRDPETGLYTLNAYGKKNYSIEALYINTNPSIGSSDPTIREESVEFAIYFTGMFLKRIPLSHFNYTSGNHDIADSFEIPFAVNAIQGPLIDALAKAKVRDTAENSIYWRLQNIPGNSPDNSPAAPVINNDSIYNYRV